MQRKKVKVQFKKLNEDAKLPKQAYPGDAGFDLYSVEDVMVYPRKYTENGFNSGVVVVDCGFSIKELNEIETHKIFEIESSLFKKGLVGKLICDDSKLQIVLLNMGINLFSLTKNSLLGKLYFIERVAAEVEADDFNK